MSRTGGPPPGGGETWGTLSIPPGLQARGRAAWRSAVVALTAARVPCTESHRFMVEILAMQYSDFVSARNRLRRGANRAERRFLRDAVRQLRIGLRHSAGHLSLVRGVRDGLAVVKDDAEVDAELDAAFGKDPAPPVPRRPRKK